MPANFKVGDEIEIDMPADLLDETPGEPKPQAIRAIGRIANLAVHPDGQLWYEFVAGSACEIPA